MCACKSSARGGRGGVRERGSVKSEGEQAGESTSGSKCGDASRSACSSGTRPGATVGQQQRHRWKTRAAEACAKGRPPQTGARPPSSPEYAAVPGSMAAPRCVAPALLRRRAALRRHAVRRAPHRRHASCMGSGKHGWRGVCSGKRAACRPVSGQRAGTEPRDRLFDLHRLPSPYVPPASPDHCNSHALVNPKRRSGTQSQAGIEKPLTRRTHAMWRHAMRRPTHHAGWAHADGRHAGRARPAAGEAGV